MKHAEPPSPAAVNDLEARMMTTESDQFVIVVPDGMETASAEIAWLTDDNAYQCKIVKLGRVMAYDRYAGVTSAQYRQLLRRMIAASVKIIHESSLSQTNAHYLQVYPDAEGSFERRTKPLCELQAPFEINVPANTVCTKDIAWPSEGIEVRARINPMQDEAQDWGIGLALAWQDGQYVQINARTDGFWGIRRNGIPYLCGTYSGGTPAVLVIVLDHKRVQLNAAIRNQYQYVAEFPRADFPRVPTAVRVGKIGKTWQAQDSNDKGHCRSSRVDWVKIF